jgi:hypothetical protein
MIESAAESEIGPRWRENRQPEQLQLLGAVDRSQKVIHFRSQNRATAIVA